ncbi:glutaminyl-peptide cyclotransferase-like isoform X2 [Oscarella lobularis]|uniref:glutaminyl-peptide cyclotransferase-like isoform X2 n=1 Tax=Oscarella lobularis TaxID=121494 RepID=UPI003313EB4F
MSSLNSGLIAALFAVIVCLLVAIMYPQEIPDRTQFGSGVEPKHSGALTGAGMKALADLSNMTRFRDVLARIAIVRVPDTPGNLEVRQFVVSQFRSLSRWTVEVDRFVASTPLGKKEFANIVVTLNPAASERLVVAAHYDSKLIPPTKAGESFVGATDSAVPCAMLIDAARALDPLLDLTETGLQMIFFDGEEAFVEWTSEDSIYGSRHLAETMASRRHPVATAKTELDVISAFILFDLIGTSDVQLWDIFPSTSSLFRRFQQIEKKLQKKGLLEPKKLDRPYFAGKPRGSLHIEDDHLPFLRKGVPILHLISVPFPRVWHKVTDNLSALDFNTIENMNLILRVFLADYFSLYS